MNFKIDENLPVELADVLARSGHDARTIHDQSMVGHDDPSVALACQSEQRAIVTLDLDFADIRTYPPANYSGIIVPRPRSQSRSAVISLLERIVPLLDTEPLVGNLWIVHETGMRIREG